MAENFANMLQEKGFGVRIMNDTDVSKNDIRDIDLCISFGGDNTFLRTAKQISNPYETAIFGVNSFPVH